MAPVASSTLVRSSLQTLPAGGGTEGTQSPVVASQTKPAAQSTALEHVDRQTSPPHAYGEHCVAGSPAQAPEPSQLEACATPFAQLALPHGVLAAG